MVETENSIEHRRHLPIILIAAVVQGWSLYALHMSISGKHWPATSAEWLFALFAIAALVPLSVQLLAGFWRDKSSWAIVAAIGVLFFYFGWHHGSRIVALQAQRGDFFGQLPFVFVLGVLWLHALPFIQARLETGAWRPAYHSLFANAWSNTLILLEAGLFTGLFWLLLMLWQQLFLMLGIRFFTELFAEPVFAYPVTSVAFGIALHLIGSLERMTKLVLAQLLNVLKWLALLAGIILLLFTIALALKLPGMIASGERAIDAAWLLWLTAVTVLLVNAAYRDGTVANPYPRLIAQALRFVIPLIVVVALTALYALYLRVDHYGFTVERVWACLVAAAACVYAIGYAAAVRTGEPWMAGIARVNIIAALFLITALVLSLTPVLSPYRIAAASQFARIIDSESAQGGDTLQNSLRYLRFSAGAYGRDRLQELAKLEGHPQAAAIRGDAADMLKQDSPYGRIDPAQNAERIMTAMVVRPTGRAVDPGLYGVLVQHLTQPQVSWMFPRGTINPVGLFIDMGGDTNEEFVLIGTLFASLFEHRDGEWVFAARLFAEAGLNVNVVALIERGDAHVSERRWKDLQIGPLKFAEAPQLN